MSGWTGPRYLVPGRGRRRPAHLLDPRNADLRHIGRPAYLWTACGRRLEGWRAAEAVSRSRRGRRLCRTCARVAALGRLRAPAEAEADRYDWHDAGQVRCEAGTAAAACGRRVGWIGPRCSVRPSALELGRRASLAAPGERPRVETFTDHRGRRAALLRVGRGGPLLASRRWDGEPAGSTSYAELERQVDETIVSNAADLAWLLVDVVAGEIEGLGSLLAALGQLGGEVPILSYILGDAIGPGAILSAIGTRVFASPRARVGGCFVDAARRRDAAGFRRAARKLFTTARPKMSSVAVEEFLEGRVLAAEVGEHRGFVDIIAGREFLQFIGAENSVRRL